MTTENEVLQFKDPSGLFWRVALEDDTALYEYVSKNMKDGEVLEVPYEIIFGQPKGGWDWQKAIKKIQKELPFPLNDEPPKTALESLPEDITQISFQDLGMWMGRLEAWRSFVASQLTYIEIERDVMADAFEVGLGKQIYKLERMSDKKKLKDGLIGYIIANDKVLKKVKTLLIEINAKCNAYRRAELLYTNQIATMSREISRRQSEMRGTKYDA
jgi:hypothetical protein